MKRLATYIAMTILVLWAAQHAGIVKGVDYTSWQDRLIQHQSERQRCLDAIEESGDSEDTNPVLSKCLR